MPDLTIDDVHRMLGLRDVQIYQLQQALEVLQRQIATLTPPNLPHPDPPTGAPA